MPDFSANNIKVDALGRVSYEFDGEVRAQSLSLSTGTSIKWTDGPGGTQVATLVASGTNESNYSLAFTGPIRNRGTSPVTLIRGDGSSDYILRAPGNITPRKLQYELGVSNVSGNTIVPAGTAPTIFRNANALLPSDTCSQTWKHYRCSVALVSGLCPDARLSPFFQITGAQALSPAYDYTQDIQSWNSGAYHRLEASIWIYGGFYSNFLNERITLNWTVSNGNAGGSGQDFNIVNDPSFTYVVEQHVG